MFDIQQIICKYIFQLFVRHVRLNTISFSHLTALQSSLVMMTGKVMGPSYTGGQNGTALLTRQFAVLKSQQQMQMNWRSGHTLYLFLQSKATPQVIFTTVMRQLYSTNLFLIELIAMLMINLQVLQNVKTG